MATAARIIFPKPVVFPALSNNKSHSATVIFCHGLNHPTPDWQTITRSSPLLRDHVKLILPQAPKRTISMRPGKAAIPAWYDVHKREIDDRVQEGDEDEESMVAAWDYIDEIIKQEEENHGVKRNRIVVGGFSQGGALTTGFGATREPVAGIVTLSAPFVLQWKLMRMKRDHANTMPWFWMQGLADTSVRPSVGRRCSGQLLEAGAKNLEYHEIPGLGHGYFGPRDLDLLHRWLYHIIPPLAEPKHGADSSTQWTDTPNSR